MEKGELRNVTIVTVATDDRGYFNVLKEGCDRYGYNFVVLGMGEKWKGFVWKYAKMKQFLESLHLDDNRIIIFVDGFDSLCLAPKDYLIDRFLELNSNIVFSIENKPENPSVRYFHNRLFPTCNGRNINSGLYMGYAQSLKQLLQTICNQYDCTDPNLDDQTIISQLCIRNDKFYLENVKLDVENKIFLNIFRQNIFKDSLSLKEKEFIFNDGLILNTKNEPIVFVQGVGNQNLDFIVDMYAFKNKGKRRNNIKHITTHVIYSYSDKFILELTLILGIIIILIIIIIGIIGAIRNKPC